MPVILASSSPRRQELLGVMGVTFTVVRPEVDETRHRGENPVDYVRRLSQEKAREAAARHKRPGIVLAADTVVVLVDDVGDIRDDSEILDKPASPGEARQMLQRLRGRAHRVCTAVTALHGEQEVTRVDFTTVYMRDYTDAEIDVYVESGDPFDKAGGYAIQHESFSPVARIEGSYTNVVGLPVETVVRVLRAVGWAGREQDELTTR